MTAPDTTRAPRGELAAKALVDSVVASDDRIERHYLEVKSTLDLTTKKDQAKVAKFILGAANRTPDHAATAFEGYGVMVIGASNGVATGIPPIEALEIQKAVLPFIGADGPRYDLLRVAVPDSDMEVLIVLVAPPEQGHPPFICRKSGDGGLRDGAVFIRADGETREARADELKQLLQRGQTAAKPVEFSVRVVGVVRPIEIDNDATIEEYISLHRNRLHTALQNAKSPTSVVTKTSDPVARAIAPSLFAVARQAQSAMQSLMEPESRSEEDYGAAIEAWEKSIRAAWGVAVLRLIGRLAEPVELEVANREKTFFHDVELKVHLEGDVHGAESQALDGDPTLDDLDLPAPPRAWGPTSKPGLAGLIHNPRLGFDYASIGSVPMPTRTSWTNSGSVDWEFSVGQLRPMEVDISDAGELVLFTLDTAISSVVGTWQITARDHHDVYTGSLEVEVGDSLDLTSEFRRLLGLEEIPA